MKSKFFYGAMFCVLVIGSIFYACKKEDETAPGVTNEEAPKTRTAQRFEGTKTYYSKNEGDTVYKMILTGDADGNISINRSVYYTNDPDTIKMEVHIEDGVDVQVFGGRTINGQYAADSILVEEPGTGVKYFFIYFEPGTPAQRLSGGAGVGYSGFCYCLMDGQPGHWDICEIFGTGKSCMWVSCPDCFYVGRLGPSWRIFKHGGGTIVEAESVSIVN